MDSGLALLLVVLGVLKKAASTTPLASLWPCSPGPLCTCVAVDAFFIFCEVLTMAYPGAAGAETLALLTTGPTAPFFWFEIICGLVIPFCILVFAKNRQSAVLINVACVLIVVGVFCKRVWLLFTAFIVPNVRERRHHLRLERGGARDGHGVVRGAELVCPPRRSRSSWPPA